MKHILFITSVCISLIACNEKPDPAEPKNGIYKIVVETEGCFGRCPIQTFSMDSSLQLNYCGYMFTTDSGCFTGTIDTATWNEVNRKLASIDYLDMDTAWAMNTDDAPGFDIWIYHANGIKKIRSLNYGEFPDSVKKVFDWIENVAVTTKKTPAGAIKFGDYSTRNYYDVADTNIQFTVPDPN